MLKVREGKLNPKSWFWSSPPYKKAKKYLFPSFGFPKVKICKALYVMYFYFPGKRLRKQSKKLRLKSSYFLTALLGF